MGRCMSILWLAITGLVMCMAGGCIRQTLIVDEQPWHLQASGIYDTLDGKRFYGVGRASNIQNSTLLKATAGNAARKEMGRVLQQYVEALMVETASRFQGPAMARDDWEQLRGIVVRNAVQRAVISDHWRPGPTRLLALCELDLDTLKRILADDTLPQADIRRVMWTAADKVHTKLSAQFQSDQQ